MTRLEELTLKLADDALNDAEASELEALLAAQPEAEAAHRQLLEVEAALRGQRETLDLAGPTLARLRTQLAVSVERGVMQQLAAGPPPDWARASQDRSRRREAADQGLFPRWKSALLPRRLRPAWNRPVIFALAASVVLLLSLSVWYFSPTMGEPVLVEVKGVDVSVERGTEFIPGANGMVLQPADVLRLGINASATIAFGAEQTRFDLSAGTELKLASLARGKHFVLQAGRIEATVARQRSFQPMVFITPQAEARVLGTKFTLTATTNATRLEVTDGNVILRRKSDDTTVKVPAGHYAVAASNTELAALPLTRGVLREYWTNLVGGNWLHLITTYTNYPNRPDGWAVLTNLLRLEMPSNWADNYGARIRGFLHPPETGAYTFWIASKDHAALWLSPDADGENKVQIATSYVTAARNWERDAAQQSASLPLTAGRRYYFEVLHKAGVGDDHLAVAWQRRGREREIIPMEFLSPFKTDAKERKP